EGTVVHPDGRLQRLRVAIAHPGAVRAGWSVIAEIAKRAGLDTGVLSSAMAFRQLVEAVAFYRGLTLEEIGGRGVRWQERDAASKLDAPELPDGALDDPPEAAAANGVLRLGARPSLWSGYVTRHAPVLEFLKPEQTVEISPA